MLPAPIHPIFRGNLPVVLQVALVTRDEANRQDLVLLQPVLALDIDHLREVLERLERAGLGDVIDQKESVAFEVRLRPEAAVFFLAGGVCEAERVGRAVDCSGYGVGVFDCRVVPARFNMSAHPSGTMESIHPCARAHSTTYSCVHWLRTKRSVIEDFPHPPSPQTVIVTRCESSMAALTVVFRKRSFQSSQDPSSSKSQTLKLFILSHHREVTRRTAAARPSVERAVTNVTKRLGN